MDLDELKSKWQKINVSPERIDNVRIVSEIARGKVESAQKKLANYFFRNVALACLVIALAPFLVNPELFEIWVGVLYAAFGLVVGVLSLVMAIHISRSNYISLPVVEAVAKVARVTRSMGRLQAFDLVLGAALIATMFAQAFDHSDRDIVWALAIGLAIGAPIGFMKYLKGKRLARKLLDEVKSCDA